MSDRLRTIGKHVARYGLVVVLLWIGGMKFTAYEAEGIQPLVANSPLMGWVYGFMSVTAFSALLGRDRDRHRAAHRAPAGVAGGVRGGQRPGRGHVPDHPDLPDHNARLGAEPGRVSGPVGDAWAVRAQGHRAAGRRPVDGRRGALGALRSGRCTLKFRFGSGRNKTGC